MATQGQASSMDLNEVLSQMQDDHKVKRRKALEKFNQIVFESKEDLDHECLMATFSQTHSSIVARMSDPSEMNRTHAANILRKFIEGNALDEKHIVSIVPVVFHRLATVPLQEESEDMRLLFITILKDLTNLFQSRMIPYMNDIINIFKIMILDSCPEVRIATCELVRIFAVATKEKFHMNSEALVKPLIKSLSHQRFKNRISAILAIGDILIYGDNSVIKEVSGPLAQRTMDLPQVRLVVVTLGGVLLTKMADRYSYWHRLLPILLSGLRDEDKEVKNKSRQLWSEVGKQFEDENEEQLKQEINFDIQPKYYPESETRFNVGCRTLVRRSIHHIIPGLLTDIDDWQENPRLEAAKLLTTLVLNAEDGIIQYAEKVLDSLFLSAGDKENHIVEQVLQCACYFGYFVPPSTYLPLVLPRLGHNMSSNSQFERPLLVLAAIMKGTPTELLRDKQTIIIEAASNHDVNYVVDPKHQSALLDLTAAMLAKCDLSAGSFDLFHVLHFILSSATNQDLIERAREQLCLLGSKTITQAKIMQEEKTLNEDMERKEDGDKGELTAVYSEYCGEMLELMNQSSDNWKEHTPECLMFVALLAVAGPSLGSHLELVHTTLSYCLGQDKDPFVSLRVFTKLQLLLVQSPQPLDSKGQLATWLPRILTDNILGYLSWHAGRTASALRTGAVSCLVAACHAKVTSHELTEGIGRCLALIPALLEDDLLDTRRLSCDAVYLITTNYNQIITSDILHTLAHKLVGRFDDVNSGVRLRAAEVLPVLFDHRPKDYDPQLQSARLKDLYDSAVIFIDDPDIKLQEAVIDALRRIGEVSPNLLVTILEKDAYKYRNKHLCDQLIDQLKSLTL